MAREYHISDVQHGNWLPFFLDKTFLSTSLYHSLIVNKLVNSLDKLLSSRAIRRPVVKIQLGMLSRFSVVAESHRLEWVNSLNTYVSFFFFIKSSTIFLSFFWLTADMFHFEQYHRTIPFDALLGGAEDVLADLGVRQALRGMPRDARL